MNLGGDKAIKEALHIKKIMATGPNGIRGEVNLARFPHKTVQQIIRHLERNGYTDIRILPL